MITISETLMQIIRGNAFLEFGFRHDLFNLTKLARYLKPQVEARAAKETQDTALTMSLSRLRRQVPVAAADNADGFVLESVTVHSGLALRTFSRSKALQSRLAKIYGQVHEKNGFCDLSLGMREVTIILDARLQDWLDEAVPQKPIYRNNDVAAVTARFPEHHIDAPGILYALMQRVTLQNINLIEITSTYTEISFFVAQQDARLLFDTFFESFSLQSEQDVSNRPLARTKYSP